MRSHGLAIGFFSVLVAAACGSPDEPLVAVDLILHNAKVATVDESFSTASAVAIREGRIVAVGDEELLAQYEAAELVDLEGKLVIPGFIDSHIHVDGVPRRYVELSEVPSIEELARRVSAKAAELGPGEWISGYGWSEDEMSEGRKPTRDDLDAAAPDNPVVLTRAGAHSAVASSSALELAGIDESSADPEGGTFERDGSGRLTGIIRERQGLVLRHVPRATYEELAPSLRARLQDLFSHGITSIVEANESIASLELWEAVYSESPEELPRATLQLFWAGEEAMASFGRKTGDGTEHLRIGAIKIFVDGGFTGPAAYTKEPYRAGSQPHRPDYRGELNLSVDELRRLIGESHEAGWQLGIHAIGDAAIELVVDELVAVLDASPRSDHRHYLNHFTVMPSARTMGLMARYGIHITQQPNFTYTLEGRYREYLDGDRLEHNNALRTPMDYGVTLALSSDILPIGPLLGLYAATTRKGKSGEVYGEGERITVREALRGYTATGAFLTFQEHELGSIEVGKLADLVVLSDDLLSIDPNAIRDVRVEQTYLGGRLVYSADAQQ